MAEHDEEREVLNSIFSDDAKFKITEDGHVRYLVECDDGSVLIEFQFHDSYPSVEVPHITLDLFHNRNMTSEAKVTIFDALIKLGKDHIGSAMIFTLIEYLNEHLSSLLCSCAKAFEECSTAGSGQLAAVDGEGQSGRPESSRLVAETEEARRKKLSKQAKRRLYDRFGALPQEKPRGWNWVDIIKHLSQTPTVTS